MKELNNEYSKEKSEKLKSKSESELSFETSNLSDDDLFNDDLSDNEKSQKFTEFDENVLNRCCDLLSYIDKNRDMLQVRQKTVTQREIKISQNSQRFQADCIIRFILKNMQICINSRKN